MPAPLRFRRLRPPLHELRRGVERLPVGVEVGVIVLIFAGWFVSLTVAAWGWTATPARSPTPTW